MRKDGTRVKNLDSIHGIMPFLMKNRCDAEVSETEIIDVTNLLDFLEEKNKGKEKEERITMFHAILTAMAKTVYNKPLLNRFISGRRYYDRNNISFSFVAKNKFEENAEERLIILKTNYDMTLFDISDKILKEVAKTRKENTNSINDTLGFVTKFPRCLIGLIMNSFKLMDFFGIVPKSIMDTDPNYTTVLLSNLGSIKCNSCYHHLNNYGTNSIVTTIGEIKEEKIGKSFKKTVDITLTLDERIADGFYFARSIKLFKYILENPKLLEDELSEKIDLENIKQ